MWDFATYSNNKNDTEKSKIWLEPFTMEFFLSTWLIRTKLKNVFLLHPNGGKESATIKYNEKCFTSLLSGHTRILLGQQTTSSVKVLAIMNKYTRLGKFGFSEVHILLFLLSAAQFIRICYPKINKFFMNINSYFQLSTMYNRGLRISWSSISRYPVLRNLQSSMWISQN